MLCGTVERHFNRPNPDAKVVLSRTRFAPRKRMGNLPEPDHALSAGCDFWLRYTPRGQSRRRFTSCQIWLDCQFKDRHALQTHLVILDFAG
jgi:hypothetical protein